MIPKGDRRYVFIESAALPEPKSFYKCFFDGDEYKQELLENLFNYLLSVNLENYDPNIAPTFDKSKLYESMEAKRSPAYLKTLDIMRENENKPMLLTDIVAQLNNIKEEANLNPTGGYEDDLVCMTINNRTIRNILDFNDTDDYQIVFNKHTKQHVLIYKNYKPTGPKEK